MIRPLAMPRAWAASMYWSSRIVSTTLRTTRAKRGVSTIASAMITLPTLGPRTDMIASARMMPGNAIMLSISRINTVSSRVKYPASMPIDRPGQHHRQRDPQPDDQRDLAALDDPAVDVPPQVVRPQNVLPVAGAVASVNGAAKRDCGTARVGS